MTAAMEFRLYLLGGVPSQDAAKMVSDLPTEKFGPTLNAMSPYQLADIMHWMSEENRKRAIREAGPLALKEAYSSLTLKALDYLRDKLSLGLWSDAIRAKDSEIQAWALDIARGRPGTSTWVWKTMDLDSRARVALILTDEQLDQLQEILK